MNIAGEVPKAKEARTKLNLLAKEGVAKPWP
jgi:hypothetical protein